MAPKLIWPDWNQQRHGPRYWLRWGNLFGGRRHFRTDHSNEWRYEYLRVSTVPAPPPGCDPDPAARSRSFSWLMGGKPAANGFRCVILGDTGEGDASQYALLPIIRALAPDFLIINGDVAYPGGEDRDFTEGFFQPYQGLGVPIWAVPGNHDYYSKQRGREFHEIFCTELRRAEWSAAGLRLMPQPGTYWELKEPGGVPNFVLLGVDSGHSGDLDGVRGKGVLGLSTAQPPDTPQRTWLEWRLRLATDTGASVLLLYHIPGLVREAHAKDSHLVWLHQLVAQFPCIQLVVTAHEHSFQRYAPAVFGRYLAQQYGATAAAPPPYLVSGAGGATISATDFDAGAKTGYLAAARYPTATDWKTWARAGQKLVAKLNLDKGIFKKLVSALDLVLNRPAEESDADRPERVSLLLLTCDPVAGVSLQPCFVDDLAQLYGHLPEGAPVQVQSGNPPVNPVALQACFRDPVIPL